MPAELPSATAARAAILDVLGRLTGNHPALLDAAAEQGMRSRDPFAPIRLRSGLDTTAAIEARAALADMPGILPATIARVARELEAGADIVAPRFQGQRGHPVGLAGHYRDALLALQGDAGARAIVAANQEKIHFVDIDDPGVVKDIDTPGDLPGR